jgi:2,3-bisphosphoglycerate-independent phosphoglycerate mutase
VSEYLPAGDGADTLRKLMEASVVILRDHPVNDERRTEGLNPANCLWLWGQGRALEWPSIADRYSLTGTVIAASEAHRGVGICAGLNVVELPTEQEEHASPYGAYRVSAERELNRRDLVYIHAGLSDDVLRDRDVKKKVEAIEEFDRELVGPLLQILEKKEAFRLLVACDPPPSVSPEQASLPSLYALCESPLHAKIAEKRFNEMDAASADTPVREATKLTARFLSRGA